MATKPSRKALVAAATELNKVLECDPPIDVSKTVDELIPLVTEASTLITEDDKISAETKATVALLSGEEAEEEETEAEEGEGEGEAEEGETETKKPAAKTKAAAKTKEPAAKRGNSLPNRYEGSKAQKMDNALFAGGTYEDMAETAGVKAGELKAHARFRGKQAGYRLEEKNDKFKLRKIEAA